MKKKKKCKAPPDDMTARKKKKMSHRSSNDVDVGVDFFFFSLGFPHIFGCDEEFCAFLFFPYYIHQNDKFVTMRKEESARHIIE